ncbi:pol protein [Cucumis melo var. makuwa]|uniref:Pol protein n=1 Tax=Cucumis melo var. makuwa TaxID=1194695 RepID=A0A5D3DQF2_CUCMM|nr:pol protein [Cucumis melo var. makuwa]TYK25715.1 pol protein [Cucumis melo var. makuwa]
MRQIRWLELVNDYDCEILYHPRKANVVVDALSRKVSHSAALMTRQVPLHRDFKRAEIAVSLNDLYFVEKRRLAEAGQDEEFSISSNDGLMFKRRLCVPADSEVKTKLLTEAHSSPFSMHPGSTKMYQDLKRVYWRQNMKREVTDFVSRCLVAPIKGVWKFEKKGKLSPCFVGPFQILEWIGPVAYRLALPPSFSSIHDIFNVSMLRKYVADPTHIVDFEPLKINENLVVRSNPLRFWQKRCHSIVALSFLSTPLHCSLRLLYREAVAKIELSLASCVPSWNGLRLKFAAHNILCRFIVSSSRLRLAVVDHHVLSAIHSFHRSRPSSKPCVCKQPLHP